MANEPQHDIGHILPDEEFKKLTAQAESHVGEVPLVNLVVHANFLTHARAERGI